MYYAWIIYLARIVKSIMYTNRQYLTATYDEIMNFSCDADRRMMPQIINNVLR